MKYSKDQIVDVLSGILYFPEGKDIVSLNMIKDIKVQNNIISITLKLPRDGDKHKEALIKNTTAAIQEKFADDPEIKTNVTVEIEEEESLKKVRNIIAVASGKGGVGKSTVAANLAVALSKLNNHVGLIDADIYGPSLPLMFDLTDSKPNAATVKGKTKIIPVEKYGIKLLSIGFFIDPDAALLWRGPMASKALDQLFNDAEWGELDYLIVDLPPGTGDIHLTLVQSFNVNGVIIVTTPQEVALADARKAFVMFNQEKINVPVLGLVENMSYFTPAELPGNKYYIFGKEGGKRLAEKSNIRFLGEIPLVQSICESGDIGSPVALDENSPVGKAFIAIAKEIIK